MTEQPERSIMDELEGDPRLGVEIALADFTLRTEQLLEAAIQARPDLHAAEIAALVGVDEPRACRVLGGDDPLRPEAFVRYMRALGYSVFINAHPWEAGTPELSTSLHQWNADLVDTYSQIAGDEGGIWEIKWHRLRPDGSDEAEPLGAPRHTGTFEGRTGRPVESYGQVLQIDARYDTVTTGG